MTLFSQTLAREAARDALFVSISAIERHLIDVELEPKNVSKVTLLSCFSSVLVCGDKSALDYDPSSASLYRDTCSYIAGMGTPCDVGKDFFGQCEATGQIGTVAEYTLFS